MIHEAFDHADIVAAIIDTNIVTNSIQDIKHAIKSGSRIAFMSRARAKFMHACDLGVQWERLVQAPTLFFQAPEADL